MEAEKKLKIEKQAWGPGPWMDEPDRKEWRHLGFPCLIVRVPSSGALCGYVAVPPGHPWHGRDYDAIDADVHGGLTYAAPCGGGVDVCHVPEPGESDNVWWLGFDHAHAGDMAPGLLSGEARFMLTLDPNGHDIFSQNCGTYRDMEYVIRGVESLAEQAMKAAA